MPTPDLDRMTLTPEVERGFREVTDKVLRGNPEVVRAMLEDAEARVRRLTRRHTGTACLNRLFRDLRHPACGMTCAAR